QNTIKRIDDIDLMHPISMAHCIGKLVFDVLKDSSPMIYIKQLHAVANRQYRRFSTERFPQKLCLESNPIPSFRPYILLRHDSTPVVEICWDVCAASKQQPVNNVA